MSFFKQSLVVGLPVLMFIFMQTQAAAGKSALQVIRIVYEDSTTRDPVKGESMVDNTRIRGDYRLPNVVPALDSEDDLKLMTNATGYMPLPDTLFREHQRIPVSAEEKRQLATLFQKRPVISDITMIPQVMPDLVRASIMVNGQRWIATSEGLYHKENGSKVAKRLIRYGSQGPLATEITALASDSHGNLYIGTPVGLSVLSPEGTWRSVQGRQGLPVEDITALAVDKDDRLWIGTSRGAILYLPFAEGRQWYYRAGKRYLINDHISGIVIAPEGMPVYFNTAEGISKLDALKLTLKQKADRIEDRLNKWHRRLGLVAACVLDNAENPAVFTIPDNDNDGLWTSYHVVAMSLAFAATADSAYLESAKKSMHALIMLQNASGIAGLVARSVVPVEEGSNKSPQWRPTPDGKMLWKSDTSSDEIDGHFFAVYAYWQHIARYDAQESALIKKQTAAVMDYIVDNNYQLIDWDGKRTRWGFWNPENLNDDPAHYIENGLNSAQILSFLKVSFHITGDLKYKEHFDHLIVDHGYLGNVLLEKKVFPDENNHSDNQLGFCALYPWLQIEQDPKARQALQQAVRRHYKTLWHDGSAFFYFAAATIDPDFVNIKAAVQNLRDIPTDRRQWRMENSHRADIIWNPDPSRFGRPQLLYVLPADERSWDKWNGNPYYPDGGGDGRVEDDGASWLLAYWMGRYHGFIADGK
jgi:hypothetical protein